MTFSAWPLSLSIISSRFTCVESELHSFLRLNGIPLCSYTTGPCCLAIAALCGVLFSRFSDVWHQWDSQAKATMPRGSLRAGMKASISGHKHLHLLWDKIRWFQEFFGPSTHFSMYISNALWNELLMGL